ncbi:MAG: N-acetyltransferase family protein [Gemmatimonadetes bacterium]|nr:MAG: N-acetyltransferase family protein [Gemmatimonadota bacterium]
MSEGIEIRAAVPGDGAAVARIYNHYVRETVVTFEEQPVPGLVMAERIRETLAAPLPWLVAEREGQVLGFAHASAWKGRCAYRFSAEVTVYIDPAHVGSGLGRRLYGPLLDELAALGVHTALAGIALPNDASVALHEHFGFEQVAHFREVGFKLGRWVDVGYWQRILDAPSREVV